MSSSGFDDASQPLAERDVPVPLAAYVTDFSSVP
jgi:hypothetical protein